MRRSDPRAGLRLMLTGTFVLLAAAAYLFARQAIERQALFASLRWTAATGLWAFVALLGLLLLLSSWTAGWGALARASQRSLTVLQGLRALNLLFFSLSVGFYAYLVLGPAGEYLEGLAVRLALLWMAVLLGAVFLKAYSPVTSWPAVLAAAWLLSGLGFKLATFIPEISTYPFSLGWSETSRYYYASLYFSERIYGFHVVPSSLHPSRYLMQAVPFLVSGLPLWFHRLWQVLLWVGLGGITVYALARRLRVGQDAILTNFSFVLFMAWGFLFLFQGPVYYHLLVVPALLLWGFDSRRFWRSLGLVLLASAWAGISRLNWFPVPGLLAMAIYILERPVIDSTANNQPEMAGKRGPETARSGARSGWSRLAAYLVPPSLWFGLGTLGAFVSQALFVLWSGIEPEVLTSSFTSDLLWYRLLPNATYPIGILPAILLVSAPLLILLIWKLRGLHPLRYLGISGILLVLFAGGVLVSTKIGGGSNLHNLDAFLVVLWVAGSYAFFGNVQPETTGEDLAPVAPKVILALILLVPVVHTISTARPAELPERAFAEQALADLEGMVRAAVQEGGEVLFITERHLLTFGILEDVPLVDSYETVFLMEMAMSNNRAYLEEFYEDINARRFALILIDPLRETLKGRAYSFGEENDVWVERVARPLLQSYRRAERFKGLGVELLEPRP